MVVFTTLELFGYPLRIFFRPRSIVSTLHIEQTMGSIMAAFASLLSTVNSG